MNRAIRRLIGYRLHCKRVSGMAGTWSDCPDTFPAGNQSKVFHEDYRQSAGRSLWLLPESYNHRSSNRATYSFEQPLICFVAFSVREHAVDAKPNN